MTDFVNHVSRETDDSLRRYHALLLKWQDKINLISPGTIKESWDRHFVDSLQLLPFIPPNVKTLYDLGSGAGFPGLVLAIARTDISVTLIESDSKKCAFLQAVSRETGVAVKVQNSRIEAASSALPAPDLVTARALASLPELLEMISPWTKGTPNLTAILPKGASFATEIEAAKGAGWKFESQARPSFTAPDARILCLRQILKTN
jgi:16S rRNA (guanine527-N7)-methyltransferase